MLPLIHKNSNSNNGLSQNMKRRTYKLKRKQYLLIFLSVFILAQVSWWIIFHFRFGNRLLNQQNEIWDQQIHTSQVLITLHKHSAESFINNLDSIFPDLNYNSADSTFNVRPEAIIIAKDKTSDVSKMFVFEGTFFSLVIAIGIGYLYWMLRKEILFERQQTNFISAISHELKTPITALRLFQNTLFMENLSEDQKNEIKDSFAHSLNDLQATIERLLNARDISPQQDFNNIDYLDISQLTKDTINDLLKIYNKENVALRYDFVENIKIRMLADKWRIVVGNILDNAIKYSGEKTELKISISNQGKTANISFIDKGCGFDNSERKKIFKMFYRIGNEDTRKHSGTGMGLYLTKEIVKLFRGKVNASSDGIGHGTTISVTLPCQKG